MRIEALCTGDELLTGVTTDTNSTWFQERLLLHGEQVTRTTVVGDVREEILEALRTLSARADVVLVSGGLGPTADDLTAEVAAEAAGVRLVLHPGALDGTQGSLREARPDRHREQHQAGDGPRGSRGGAEPRGQRADVRAPPREGGALLRPRRPARVPGAGGDGRAPAHRRACGPSGARRASARCACSRRCSCRSRTSMPGCVRCWPTHPHVTFGFRTHFPENHLKLMAAGRTEVEAREALEAADAAARPLLGDHLFGVDDETMAGVVGQQLARPGRDGGPGRELHRRAHRRHADRVARGERVLPGERGVVRQPPEGGLGGRGARDARGRAGRSPSRWPGRWRAERGRAAGEHLGALGHRHRRPRRRKRREAGGHRLHRARRTGRHGGAGPPVPRRPGAGARRERLRRPGLAPAPHPRDGARDRARPAAVDARGGRPDLDAAYRTELLLFVCSLFALACFSGPRFLRQSAAPHFVYQAKAWLDGTARPRPRGPAQHRGLGLRARGGRGEDPLHRPGAARPTAGT